MEEALQRRLQNNNLRELSITADKIDFSSNDYLGMARNAELHRDMLNALEKDISLLFGSTGSRLISGNDSYTEALENSLAETHQVPAALLFPSGYTANLSLASCLAGRHDSIIVDEYIHSSIHEGCRLSLAKKYKFKHNQLNSLIKQLENAKGQKFVFIESLYSMEGSLAPLRAIASICSKYQAKLIVDEAHAYGVYGAGIVYKEQLQNQIFASLITFGKAVGAHGAAVLSNKTCISYLINFSKAFIYSTALPKLQWLLVGTSLEYLGQNPQLKVLLRDKIKLFKKLCPQAIGDISSPIQIIIIPGNQAVKNASLKLKNAGFSCVPILSPTVKINTERIRICIHIFNSDEEIIQLATCIQAL